MQPFIKFETTKTFMTFYKISLASWDIVILLSWVGDYSHWRRKKTVLRSCCFTDLEFRIINGMSKMKRLATELEIYIKENPWIHQIARLKTTCMFRFDSIRKTRSEHKLKYSLYIQKHRRLHHTRGIENGCTKRRSECETKLDDHSISWCSVTVLCCFYIYTSYSCCF